MGTAEERISIQISTQELERRWNAVRAAMKEKGIDYLIMQNREQFLGGYVKWFTDIPAFNGYPTTVVFPRDDEMTLINIGPKMNPSGFLTDLSTKDWALRGVKNRFTAPYFPSLHYSKTYDGELIVDLLKSEIVRLKGLREETQKSLEEMQKHLEKVTQNGVYVKLPLTMTLTKI